MSDKKNRTLEELFEQLDQTLEKMEQGNLPLDQAFSLYESGLKTLKQCNDKLDLIEKKMLELNQNGEAVPFE